MTIQLTRKNQLEVKNVNKDVNFNDKVLHDLVDIVVTCFRA